MNINGILGAAGGAVLAIGLVAASPADATPPPRASVAGDTLTVTGTSRSDQIVLRLAAGAPGTFQVDFGGDGSAEHSFDRNTFSAIRVRGGSNSDQIRIDQSNGAFADEATTLHGGSGNDILEGGAGNEVLNGGSGDDAVDGNQGNDTADLGAGSDSFRWDPGDGSDVIDGRSGLDTLDFNGANANENMSLSANGRDSLFLRDVGNIRMDMDNVERLDLTTLGGTDGVTVDDMSGTDFRRADLDLSSQGVGDLQPDTVTINGTDDDDDIRVETDDAAVEVEGLRTETGITGSETIDLLQVNALDGDDDVDVDDAVSALIQVVVDLGSGQS